MPAPTWSKEPPTEPGFYWWRFRPGDEPTLRVVQIRHGGPKLYTCKAPVGLSESMENAGGEWYSTPIQPPETP